MPNEYLRICFQRIYIISTNMHINHFYCQDPRSTSIAMVCARTKVCSCTCTYLYNYSNISLWTYEHTSLLCTILDPVSTAPFKLIKKLQKKLYLGLKENSPPLGSSYKSFLHYVFFNCEKSFLHKKLLSW